MCGEQELPTQRSRKEAAAVPITALAAVVSYVPHSFVPFDRGKNADYISPWR